MSLSNAAVVTAPSAFGPTGGIALTFASAGSISSGCLTLYVPADTDLRLRRTMKCTAKSPNVQITAPNGYTQARTETLFTKPKLLANGKLTTNTVRISVAYDIETTQLEIQELLDVGAQALVDADFSAYHKALAVV
jgi:hypothetical protein